MRRILKLAIIGVSSALFVNAAVADSSSTSDLVKYAWVQMGPPHVGIVRAITAGSTCPKVILDRSVVRMRRRAAPDADFDVLTCEASIPPGVDRLEVAGKRLRAPALNPKRIAVVGDTGCRLKAGNALDDGFQACNDPDDWEFAKVAAQVAASKPDLIIHVGDYIYREQPCDGSIGCEGSPFNSPGMRWATWEADFFAPAAPMLEAAPIIFVRGDHEQCERAGAGFFRFLHPFRRRHCLDFTDPYALDLGGLKLIVMDTVQAVDTALSPEVVRDRYEQDFEAAAELTTGSTWLLSHRPIWAIRPTGKDGSATEIINVTVQDALRKALGGLSPQVNLVLTGHIHLGEVLSFTGGRPPQIVAGIGGTKLLPDITAELTDTMLDGERITHATIVAAHGFMTFELKQPRSWIITMRNAAGEPSAVCELSGKSASCASD
jgi:hypothetical protein